MRNDDTSDDCSTRIFGDIYLVYHNAQYWFSFGMTECIFCSWRIFIFNSQYPHRIAHIYFPELYDFTFRYFIGIFIANSTYLS